MPRFRITEVVGLRRLKKPQTISLQQCRPFFFFFENPAIAHRPISPAPLPHRRRTIVAPSKRNFQRHCLRWISRRLSTTMICAMMSLMSLASFFFLSSSSTRSASSNRQIVVPLPLTSPSAAHSRTTPRTRAGSPPKLSRSRRTHRRCCPSRQRGALQGTSNRRHLAARRLGAWGWRAPRHPHQARASAGEGTWEQREGFFVVVVGLERG